MKAEFSQGRETQIRAPNGDSFWPEPPSATTTDEWDVRRVDWNGRKWACKEQERTLNEIVAYQIARAIDLPVQPWLAFNSPSEEFNGAGILIEWWNSSAFWEPIEWVDADEAAVRARALALWVFNGDELPHWLLSEDKTQRRLMDLEGIGPYLPLRPNALSTYRAKTEEVYTNRRREAGDLQSMFDSEVLRLASLDFSEIVDLSGHPKAEALTRSVLKSLKTRQCRLGKVLDLRCICTT